MPVRRAPALEAGLFLICVALPLSFFPAGLARVPDAKPLFLTAGTLLIWVSGIEPDRPPRPAWPRASRGRRCRDRGRRPFESLEP